MGVTKITLPGRKKAFRLYNKNNEPLVDVMMQQHEEDPIEHKQFLLRHPFVESKRAYVIPNKVEKLHSRVFEDGRITKNESLQTTKNRCEQSLKHLRQDHRRRVNPTPYKVSLSDRMYKFLHDTWLQYAPIGQIE